jgi:hypothetical protein
MKEQWKTVDNSSWAAEVTALEIACMVVFEHEGQCHFIIDNKAVVNIFRKLLGETTECQNAATATGRTFWTCRRSAAFSAQWIPSHGKRRVWRSSQPGVSVEQARELNRAADAAATRELERPERDSHTEDTKQKVKLARQWATVRLIRMECMSSQYVQATRRTSLAETKVSLFLFDWGSSKKVPR